MKKKSNIFVQLNKSTVVKAVVIAVLLAVIEILTGALIYNQIYERTYKEEFARYSSYISSVSRKISDGEASFPDGENEMADFVKTKLAGDTTFDHYFLCAEGGTRIIGNDGFMSDDLYAYNLTMDKTTTFEMGGVTYVFASAKIGKTNFHICGVSDFTDREAIITAMRQNVAAYLVIAGVLVLCAFVFYVYWAGGRKRIRGYGYRLIVDKDGKITRSNARFKRDFPAVNEIKSYPSYDKKNFNLVKMYSGEGEKLLVVKAGYHVRDKRAVYAGIVANSESFVQTTDEDGGEVGGSKAEASFLKVFENFTKRGKRTLIGVMNIGNLEQIKTMFGKQMAENIQAIVVKKVREKFTYVFELDFASLGVIFPDGKKLDNLITDLPDMYRYISTPIKMDDNLFTVDLKSGFAMCDAAMESLTFDYALKAAQAAYQRAVDTGIADYIIYHESQKKLYAKYFITFDIKQMLSEGAFEMEYQPQYNIKEERIEGFEALFRVKKSWNVNVDTFSFITYAERTGAMVQLGDFIFDTGMQFAKRLEGKNVSVSLNVSPVQLMQAGFTENFLKLYKKYDLKPGSICVEITESFLMTNFNETLKKLDILTAQGINIHLDDFGTEYSSLLYIKKLPISTIKIDKEFVKDVLKSKESQAIIKFITNIAKLLNRTTICEGVETVQEFDMLNYLGCDTIQGWLIGKSMKSDDAYAIVDSFDYKKVAEAQLAKQAANAAKK